MALPLPMGDPGGLWQAARWLRAAASEVAGTRLGAAGALPDGATQGWSGLAAQEAASEAHVVGTRVSALADRMGRAAAVLGEYGDALDAAQRIAVGLQSSYDAALPAGPAGPSRG